MTTKDEMREVLGVIGKKITAISNGSGCVLRFTTGCVAMDVLAALRTEEFKFTHKINLIGRRTSQPQKC
jgi:hypothetical protein